MRLFSLTPLLAVLACTSPSPPDLGEWLLAHPDVPPIGAMNVDPMPDYPFTTDGCSMWPDSPWGGSLWPRWCPTGPESRQC